MSKVSSLFITFEGGEGAGKTTLIDKLEKKLLEKGLVVVRTREPGGSRLGERIRQWLLNRDFNIRISPMAELLLFLSARAQHIEEVIKPALGDGEIVLCDRFNDSTVAYQGAARGIGTGAVQELCDIVCDGVTPDLTFYLDVDPQIGLERTARVNKENAIAGEVDRIEEEKLDFHEHVRQAFLHLANEEPNRMHVLDANQTEEVVFKAAWQTIESYLKR